MFINLIRSFMREIVRKFCRAFVLLFFTRLLWDSWGADVFVAVFELLDLVLSAMDGIPLSVGGGGSGVGPSQRPLPDLNQPPAEVAPDPDEHEALRRYIHDHVYSQL